jgi:hypothetical protein
MRTRSSQRGPLVLDATDIDPFAEGMMYFVAGALAVLSGLFYLAGNNEMGSFGPTMCQYGDVFCDKPYYVLVGAILAGLWATFVSIR